MMLLILILLFVVLFGTLIVQAVKLRNMIKHDKVLFSFQASRSELALAITDALQHPDISNTDLAALRNLSNQTESAIKNFDTLKVEFFHFSHFFKVITNVRLATESLKEISTHHPLVQDQKIKFGSRILYAYVVYIPFLRFRLLMKILGFLTHFLIRQRIARLRLTGGYRIYRDLESNYNNDLSHC